MPIDRSFIRPQALAGLAVAGSLAAGAVALAAPPKPAPSQTPSVPNTAAGASGRGPVLVELFTSQGCDSCPAADEFVGELPKLGYGPDRVVPITFHVGYWDDLGWKDPFAQEAFSQRQMSYAPALAGKGVGGGPDAKIKGPYTPQLVVDGSVHLSGSRRDDARGEFDRAAKAAAQIELAATATLVAGATRPTVKIKATSRVAPGAKFDTDTNKVGLFAVLMQREVTTKVSSGENKGKDLREFNVARVLQGPKLFRSARPVNETEFELAAPEGLSAKDVTLAVFAQDMASMRVLAARMVPISTATAQAPGPGVAGGGTTQVAVQGAVGGR